MLKRTLSIILAVAMLCTLVPAYAFAEEAVEEVVVEEVVVENEEVAVEEAAEEVIEEEVEVALAADPFSTAEIVPEGIKMPETIANYNVTMANDRKTTASVDDLPANSITYVLVDSDNAAMSNFTSDYKGVWINTGSGVKNPWIDASGANTRRAFNYDNVSKHTATIVVPDSVGEEGKEFQVVGMNIRTSDVGSIPERCGLNGRGSLVWIDGKPVTASADGHDCIGNIFDHKLWIDQKNFVNWTLAETSGKTYFVWEWGPTVTLTPGEHVVEFTPAPGSAGGRMPGLIITDAVAYDWTKIAPLPDAGYDFATAANWICKDFAGSFGKAGYIDFVGPKFDGEVVVDEENTTATTLVFSIPTATDVAETKPGNSDFVKSAYADYADVKYTVYVNDEEVEAVDGVVTVDGLAPATECEILVVAEDMLGNKSELKATAATAGGEALDYAFFAVGSVIKNVTPVSEAETKVSVEWTAAVPGTAVVAEPVVTYNVYVDGALVAENVAETKYTVEGLKGNTTYSVKVVTCSDGVVAEAEDVSSSLETSVSTAREPELTEVPDSVTATSVTLAASSTLDPSAFTFEIEKVLVNTVEAEATVEGNLITVTGLFAGSANTIKVFTKETQISTGVVVPVEYPLVTVVTPAAEGNFTLTLEDCLPPASDLPLPLCYDTVPSAQWPVDPGNSQGALWWKNTEVWRTDKGNVSSDVAFAEGSYYAVTLSYAWDAARYFVGSIDGKTITAASGSTWCFGKDAVSTPTNAVLSVCDKPITLTKGTHKIELKTGNGILRVDMFAFVPAKYAYKDGVLLNEAGEYESIVTFVNDTFTSKQNFLDFYITPDLLTKDSLTAATLTEDTVAVKWMPTTTAVGKDITYNIFLDGAKVAEVKSNEVPQYVFEGLTPGAHTVKIDANGTYAQTIKIYASAVTTELNVDYETVVEDLYYADGTPVEIKNKDGEVIGIQKGNVDILDSITLSLASVGDETKNLSVVVATFGLNKMVKTKVIPVALTYGRSSVEIDLAGLKTQLCAQNEKVDPDFLCTKIFVIDDNGFVPYMSEY